MPNLLHRVEKTQVSMLLKRNFHADEARAEEIVVLLL